MADQFKDQPLQFVAITDEKDAVVAPFLKKKPMHAWVGLDTDRSMIKDYGITGIPHTVVVDREGRIVAITHPSSLTAQHLKDVLAGKKLALAQPGSGKSIQADQVPCRREARAGPAFSVLIRPTEEPRRVLASPTQAVSDFRFKRAGCLAACCDVRVGRILPNCPLPKARFEVQYGSKRQVNRAVMSTGCGGPSRILSA
jgi:hypothetical protein